MFGKRLENFEKIFELCQEKNLFLLTCSLKKLEHCYQPKMCFPVAKIRYQHVDIEYPCVVIDYPLLTL